MFKTSNKENESRRLLAIHRANAVKNPCKIEREAPVHWSPMKSSIN